MKYSKFISIFIFCIYIFSCKNSNEDIFNGIFTSGELAEANIISVTDVRDTTAIVICDISSKGKGYISAHGVCWNLTPNPTIENPHTATKDTGNIAMKLTKLSLGTTYYVRPYITNSVGTSYGTEFHFTTKNIPTITTTSPTNITAFSATLSGNVTTDGGDSVTVRGVCWGTTTKPTTALATKTVNGAGKGVFVSEITGITIGTTYYARAYCSNAYATVYGNEIKFNNLPTVTTNAVSNISISSATCGGTIRSDGGSSITGRGVCWSVNSAPTITDSKTSNGISFGTFTSDVTGLTPNITYYVRAYATNSIGTTYGDVLSFVPGFFIGSLYLGGKIAYLDTSGKHGFVCALADQSMGISWYNGNNITTGAINDHLDENGVYGFTKSGGRKNTDVIILKQGTGSYAASICAALTTGDATPGDWYLPSISELNQIYINKNALGGFSTLNYWSSTEGNYNSAWYQNMYNGIQEHIYSKLNGFSVRAVRAF